MSAKRVVFVLVCAVLLAELAAAQTVSTGAIAGVVRDASGAILPGATAEVASPALIEKVRTAVTDGQGNYKIADLPPGTYSVTFTLPGFNTVKREGLQLSAGFTATVNGDLKVGGIQETVVVTGASPVVDIQNVRSQQVLTSKVLDALPSSTRDISQMASLTLGATSATGGRNDVGGDKGEMNNGIVLHGGRGDDGRVNVDGMNTNGFWGNGGGQQRVWKINTMAVQEVVIDTGGSTSETETGGANMNVVPRDGANRFTGHGVLAFANTDMASGKVPDDLIARGSAADQNSVKKLFDYGVGIGGRVIRDRLWFYSSNRYWGTQAYAANNYFNKSTDWRVYVPDLSRRAYTDVYLKDFGGRFTAQVTSKHKINVYTAYQSSCNCFAQISAGVPVSPEANDSYFQRPMSLVQPTWNFVATNRLLVQTGASFLKTPTAFTGIPLPTAERVSILEQTIGYRYNARNGGIFGYQSLDRPQQMDTYTERVAVSYTTGTHAIKTGVQALQGRYDVAGDTLPNGVMYTFRGGLPVSLTQWATPFANMIRIRSFAFYAQDQWRVKNLTFNYGVRYDHFWVHSLPVSLPAGRFVPARSYPRVDDLPNYQDVAPRVGVSYDVFGKGKTAIKGAWGRYPMGQGGGYALTVAPANAIVPSSTRTWNDANGNFAPDCVLTNSAGNGECGPLDNALFGQSIVNLTWPESARKGWNIREYQYQFSLGVQQELWPGAGLNVSYFRTDWRNQLATVNTALTPADYTSYCIAAPTDSRLGEYSGERVCGLYDVNPGRFGRVQNVFMLAKQVPGATDRPKEVFNGLDTILTARFKDSGVLVAGLTVGRTVFDYCWAKDLPNVLPQGMPATLPRTEGYCKVQSPLWSGVGSQFKVQVVYPLPWDITLSGVYKNLPGIPIAATQVLTNAQIAPSLGRNLAACPATGTCTATATVSLLPTAVPVGGTATVGTEGALFDTRLNQVDFRLTRTFRLPTGGRIQPTLDLYNALNSRVAQSIFSTYGASWLRPTSILGGRLFKIGAQVDF